MCSSGFGSVQNGSAFFPNVLFADFADVFFAGWFLVAHEGFAEVFYTGWFLVTHAEFTEVFFMGWFRVAHEEFPEVFPTGWLCTVSFTRS